MPSLKAAIYFPTPYNCKRVHGSVSNPSNAGGGSAGASIVFDGDGDVGTTRIMMGEVPILGGTLWLQIVHQSIVHTLS